MDAGPIIYNGELYNFRELRSELEQEGWAFRTRSDTEVLIAGAAIWGVRALARRIDGMAAFALWDAVEKRLHLVRDRFGVKPLYLWRTEGRLAFASEIKAFLAHPEFRVRVNQAALREYFTFQNLFRSHTLFDGVEQLPSATILTIDRSGERRETFWDYDFSHPEPMDPEEGVERLETLMASGCRASARVRCTRGSVSVGRHGFWHDGRARKPALATHADFHGRLRDEPCTRR